MDVSYAWLYLIFFVICNLYIGYFSNNDSKITLKIVPRANELFMMTYALFRYNDYVWDYKIKLTRPYTQGCLLDKVILALVKWLAF